ncbi:MAG: RagB/SusD family nutrient uptake outer membrane protein [Cyclobacteriaceae bacterium]
MKKHLSRINIEMKSLSNKATILGLILTCGLASCDDLLNANADGNISGDVYKSEANIKAALNGAYYSLGGIYDGIDGGELFGGDFMLIPALFVAQNGSELVWDRARAPLYSDFVDNNVVATNVRIESNWRRAYEVINLLNNIIKNIDNVTSEKDRVYGEALAMRGILYFEMVRFWGAEYETGTVSSPSIPLLTEPIEEVNQIVTPTLATVGAVYTQVEADLNQASTLLESLGTNGTSLSYYACQAYLMRAAMHKGQYADAEDYADNILTSSSYGLANTPMDAFNNTSNSSEDIFAIQQTVSNNTGDITSGTGLTNYYASLNGVGVGAFRVLGGGLTTKSESLVNGARFSPVDLRGMRDSETTTSSQASDIDAPFYKHITSTSLYSPAKFLASDRVVPVVRLAEIYLARAESIYEQSQTIDADAIADLNEIRTRAALPALQVGDFASPQALMDSIKLEKKREFLYEGLVFHDLKRWNDEIGNSTPESFGQDEKFILPIPQAEVDTWGD